MKKILFTILLLIGLQSNFAQHGGGGYSPCATEAIEDLADCLAGINYHLTAGGAGFYLYAWGNPPPGHITSCLVHYDNDRDDCPDAPVIVEGTAPTFVVARAR